MPLGRRDLLIGGGLLGVAVGWQLWGVRPPSLELRAIMGAPGWQFGTAGDISGALDTTLVGIPDPAQPDLSPFKPDALEAAVFGSTRRAGYVPMAVFSDYFCPYCRILFARLTQRLNAPNPPPITIAWHELPLLGPSSQFAARALMAASLQGGYAIFHSALIRDGLRPAPAAMGRIADAIGLNGAQLIADMDGPQVADRLHQTARAAGQLGVYATPGLIVGRNLVLGALDAAMMDDLIATTPPQS